MTEVLDLIISDATVIDGTGRPAYPADVGVTDGRITLITAPGGLRHVPAKERHDAGGNVLAPGFIDGHTHSDLALLAAPDGISKITQGVTTEIVGNCGWSTVPGGHAHQDAYRDLAQPVLGFPDTPWSWTDQAGYFRALERHGTLVNVAALVGHGALRAAVMGFEDRRATAGELDSMKGHLHVALDQGALGMSTGLAYAPGCFAPTDELVALARVVARHGGLYATHLRDQVDGLVASVDEALRIGREAEVPVLISHHKTVGTRNFGRVRDSLARLDAQHDVGPATYSDIYPYLAGSSSMLPLLPPWVLSDARTPLMERLSNPDLRARIRHDLEHGLEGWENRSRAVGWEAVHVARVGSDRNRAWVGRTIAEVAQQRGVDAIDALLDLLADEDGNVSSLIVNSCEEDLVTMLRHPRTMIGSDGIDVGDRPHPRLYGTFPRILGHYVREIGVLPLEAAIHKMTGLTASVFGLANRGRIAQGCHADLVLFDPNSVADHATYDHPRRIATGIRSVWVGGEEVLRQGLPTGRRPGSVLRRHIPPMEASACR